VQKIVDGCMNGHLMITHVLKLEEINKSFDLMREAKSIRSVVIDHAWPERRRIRSMPSQRWQNRGRIAAW
jgi:hypothetical protein